MKKKKKKLLLKHEVIFWSPSNFGEITITKHSDLKTGVTMYTLDLDDVPCITCDNLFFLTDVVIFDSEFIGERLSIILDSRSTMSFSESEE